MRDRLVYVYFAPALTRGIHYLRVHVIRLNTITKATQHMVLNEPLSSKLPGIIEKSYDNDFDLLSLAATGNNQV
jgi:hypothetical protein